MSTVQTSLSAVQQSSRVTLITGASSGIGAGLARRLGQKGDDLILLARRADRLEALAEEIRAQGRRVEVLAVDVTERASLRAGLEQACERIGPVDVLVANAGLGTPTSAQRFSAEAFEKVIQVNLLGVANCVEAVLPSMLARGQGQLVGIASLAGYRGLPGSAAYCASKAGLRSFFESLRIDLNASPIDVTTICPGFIRTPMTENQKFPMPFLMDLEPAIDCIERAMRTRRSEYAFPFPLSTLVRLARWLPNRLYDGMMSGRKKTS